jgi:hypothetical protein
MGLKHFIDEMLSRGEVEEAEIDEKDRAKIIREGQLLLNLTKSPGFSIIKDIIVNLEEEYLERTVIERDYSPMYGRESLKRLLENIEGKIQQANSYLKQES